MKISQGLAKQFNDQYNAELNNALTYQAMANIMRCQAWNDYAKFFAKQSAEEYQHAEGIADFLNERGACAMPDSVKSVKLMENADPAQLAQLALTLEQQNTQKIVALDEAAEGAGDKQACYFLVEYIKEQTHSEGFYIDLVAQLKRAGQNVAAVLEIGEHLNG